jgi:hypothetical protein
MTTNTARTVALSLLYRSCQYLNPERTHHCPVAGAALSIVHLLVCAHTEAAPALLLLLLLLVVVLMQRWVLPEARPPWLQQLQRLITTGGAPRQGAPQSAEHAAQSVIAGTSSAGDPW